MTDASLDQLGPVDYIVVEIPAGASDFTGDMAKELVALVDSGTIRVIDVLILTKDEDGSVEAMGPSDVPDLGPLPTDRVRTGRAVGRGRRRRSLRISPLHVEFHFPLLHSSHPVSDANWG